MIPAIALSSRRLNVSSSEPASVLQGSSLTLVTPVWRDAAGKVLSDTTKVRFGLYEPNHLPVWITTGISTVPYGGFQATVTLPSPGDWVVFAEYADASLTTRAEKIVTVDGSVLLGGAEAPDSGTPVVWLDALAAAAARKGAEDALQAVRDASAAIAAAAAVAAGLEAAKGASQGLVKPNGASTARPFLSWVSGKVLRTSMFGVAGDGVTDDTVPLTAAIAAMQPGDTLDWEGKQYAISSWLFLNTPNTRHMMAGSVIRKLDWTKGSFVVLADSVTLDRATISGVPGNRDQRNPRRYWANTDNTRWYGCLAYHRACEILVGPVQDFKAIKPKIEHVYHGFYLAGNPFESRYSYRSVIEDPVLNDMDFGILITCQHEMHLKGRITGELTTLVTREYNADGSVKDVGLPPHLIYFSGSTAQPNTACIIDDIYHFDNNFDSVMKVKGAPFLHVKTLHGKTTGILTNISESPGLVIDRIIGEDIYESAADGGWAVAVLSTNDVVFKESHITLRDGAVSQGFFRLLDGSSRCQILNAKMFSRQNSTSIARPIQIENSHYTRIVNPQWWDSSDALIGRALVSLLDSNYTSIESPELSNTQRVVDPFNTTSYTSLVLDPRKLRAGLSIGEDVMRKDVLTTGVKNAIYWVGYAGQSRRYTASFTLACDHNGQTVRCHNSTSSPAITVTISPDLEVGMRGRLMQTSAAPINVVAGTGITLRGPTATNAAWASLDWEVITTSEIVLSAR